MNSKIEFNGATVSEIIQEFKFYYSEGSKQLERILNGITSIKEEWKGTHADYFIDNFETFCESFIFDFEKSMGTMIKQLEVVNQNYESTSNNIVNQVQNK